MIIHETHHVGVFVHIEADELVLFQEAFRIEDFNRDDFGQLVQAHPMVNVEVAFGGVIGSQYIDVLQQKGVAVVQQLLESGVLLTVFGEDDVCHPHHRVAKLEVFLVLFVVLDDFVIADDRVKLLVDELAFVGVDD